MNIYFDEDGDLHVVPENYTDLAALRSWDRDNGESLYIDDVPESEADDES